MRNLCFVVMISCGAVGPAPMPDAGQMTMQPPPYTGPYMYNCTKTLFCTGIDSRTITGGSWCARSATEANTQEKATCTGCSCSVSCTRTNTRC